MAVRVVMLETDAMVWTSSSVLPSLGCRRARIRRPSEALLQAFDPRERPDDAAAAEATGALPPRAAFRAVFVIEPLQGDRLDVPCEVLRWGRPFRLRHILSGAYLSVDLRPSALTSTKGRLGATLVFRPGFDAMEEESEGESECEDDAEGSEASMALFERGTAFFFASPHHDGAGDDRVRLDSAVGWLQVRAGRAGGTGGVVDAPVTLFDTGEAVLARGDRRACRLRTMIPVRLDPSIPDPHPLVPDSHHRREIEANSGLGFSAARASSYQFKIEVNMIYQTCYM
jgi:hypothetical protein